MKTPKEQLDEVRQKIKALNAQKDLSEEETEELTDLTNQAVKLKARVIAEQEVAEAETEEKARIEREKKEAVAEAVKAEAAKHRRLPTGVEAPYQANFSDTWRYDNLTPAELSLVIDMGKRMGVDVGRGAYKAMALKVAEMKDSNTEDSRKMVGYIKAAFKAGTGIEPTAEAVSAAMKTSGDPDYTTGSLTGSDWVGTAYSSEIWAAIRASVEVLNRIPSDTIPDGYSNKYWPLESTDPTWYKVAEASAGDATLHVPAATITSSTLATLNKQITVGKIGARSLYSGEMTEDSLIGYAPQLREQLQKSGAEILEHIAIDGDVETSANKNINAIDSTPASTQPYLVCDGFRKLALVTNTANSRSASGGLVIEDYIDTLKLMGTAGLAGSDPRQVAFIVDGNVHYANMKLPEVKTRDVHSAATIENGFLRMAYGVPIIPSWQMHRISAKRMAESTGKIDETDSDNTLGAIVAIRFDQWRQAFKRRMTLETTRIANADAWEVVALIRWGMAYRDNEASAVTYNVGV